jgi:hypothetical protein
MLTPDRQALRRFVLAAGMTVLLGTGPQVACAAILGADTVGNSEDAQTYGYVNASKFVSPVDGIVDRLWIYFSPVSNWDAQYRLALYSNTYSGSTPCADARLRETGTQWIYNGTGWYSQTVSPYTVQAGTIYWLAFQTSSSNNYDHARYAFDPPDEFRSEFWNYSWNTFPNTLGTSPDSVGNWYYSVYAEVTSFTPTRTPTATPTPTTTRSRTPTPTVTISPTLTPVLSPTPTFTATPSSTVTRTCTPAPTLTQTLTPFPVSDLTGDKLVLYPNPARGNQVQCAFIAAGAGTAEFVLFNAAYQKVAGYSRSIPAAGPRVESLSTAELAPGVYLCRLVLVTSGNRRALPVAKLIVIK